MTTSGCWTSLGFGGPLDSFDRPVLVLDSTGRVVAANGQMAALCHRSPRSLHGLLGGEVMECSFARMPGGCGNTVHCKACAIRECLADTLATGKPIIRCPAFVVTGRGRVDYFITTRMRGELLEMIVEEPQPGELNPG